MAAVTILCLKCSEEIVLVLISEMNSGLNITKGIGSQLLLVSLKILIMPSKNLYQMHYIQFIFCPVESGLC